ncbi:MAG: PilZ domain-containing protein, partial [Gammaproteobacteria bacterium]
MSTMHEQRAIQRILLPCYLQVHNRITNRPLGFIVNLSQQGMCIVSKKRLLTHALFELTIEFPQPLNGIGRFDLQALSHWCTNEVEPEYYDTGFSFTKPPKDLDVLVDALNQYFQFKN